MSTAQWLRENGGALARLLEHAFAVRGELSALRGELDHNVRVHRPDGDLLCKVMRADCEPQLVALQVAALDHVVLRAGAFPVPRPLRTREGAVAATLVTPAGSRLVWLVGWIDGLLLAEVRPPTAALHRQLGAMLGALDRALLDFAHPAAARPLPWDLQQAAWIGDACQAIADAELRAVVEALHADFAQQLGPRLLAVRQSIIHGDANDHNVVVAMDGPAPRIAGLIDFGDLCRSALVGEVAIAAAYAAAAADDPLAAIDAVVAGYDAELPLGDDELDLLFPALLLRLSISATTAAVRQRQATAGPDPCVPGPCVTDPYVPDPYVTVSQPGVRRLLLQLHGRDRRLAAARLRHACGRAANPRLPLLAAFLAAQRPAPVLGGTPPPARWHVLDLSFASLLGGDDPLAFDAATCGDRIAAELRAAAATVGIGRYAEPRPLYTGPGFGECGPVARRRTVHLGIDLFAPAGTEVHAPLDGEVVTAIVCPEHLDYGGLVVLRHETDDGIPFGTLHGHLEPRCAAELRPGQRIARGEAFAVLGAPPGNGGWPPHLHFQLLAEDPMALPPVPPGVADPDDLPAHLALYPDPAPLLGLDARAAFQRRDPAQLVARRARHFAANLRTSYAEPLHLVRGFGHVLFDADGRPHLDAYNNVPHVGHCHPRVVRAVHEQSALLATNTRYLHDGLARYAERLCALLPQPLAVCFFVPSGSEANELALRLARAHTGAKDLLVMDHGYHGHTTGAMAISPYKLARPGAPPKPSWVHVTVQPDAWRCPFPGPDAGPRHADMVVQQLAALEAAGRRIAGYLCECLPSVGGQLVLPQGFLSAVYAAVRAAGGLCIADDVQTALWRTGSHAFGFELQGVVPDVLVLGKPLGNGYPLGAVVTTRAVAESFARGPEFFSTFGGNTVACAAGLAVLDVLRDEDLAANARRVGERLLSGLRELQRRHALIGDVRGTGLFLGVELVQDRDRKTPAAAQTAYVVERLRQRRVLIGSEGPLHNVLKIRPPLSFDLAAADVLLHELDRALGEDPAQPTG